LAITMPPPGNRATCSSPLSEAIECVFGGVSPLRRCCFVDAFGCLRAQQIELFDADGKYLGPFLVGKEDGTTISEPQNLFFHSCPVLSYPQMNSNLPHPRIITFCRIALVRCADLH
jgi:hypothetical protein